MTPADVGVLAHRVAGHGETVVLLNGGLMSVAAWDPVALPLERSHQVLRCDFRGQLLSPGPPPPTVGGHVADVLALLDALSLPRVHLVGTSFGAAVGVLLAARLPDRVASLCALTATDRVTPETWAETRALREACRAAVAGEDGGRVFDLMLSGTFSARYLNLHREALEVRRHQVAAMPAWWFEGLDGLLGALEGLDVREAAARVACPTLVVSAELDLTFPPERSQALAAAIPGARLVTVPGSGHALVVEQPDRVVALVSDFLARDAGEGGAS